MRFQSSRKWHLPGSARFFHIFYYLQWITKVWKLIASRLTPSRFFEFTQLNFSQGDSGGPMQVIRLEEKNLYDVVGLTSFGVGCSDNIPGVYTRVYRYLGWIADIVWPKTRKQWRVTKWWAKSRWFSRRILGKFFQGSFEPRSDVLVRRELPLFMVLLRSDSTSVLGIHNTYR